MNIIITILLILVGLVALVLIIALFVKKDYSIQRSIVIDRPRPEVFDYIKHLKNQDYYNKFVMADPNMKKTFRGTDGTEGFVYGWNGNKQAGEGEQEITKIQEGERLDVEIRFVQPFAGLAHAPYITETVEGNKTKVNWGLTSQMKYPMNFMLLFMNMDKMLGKELEESLHNLKTNLEKK